VNRSEPRPRRIAGPGLVRALAIAAGVAALVLVPLDSSPYVNLQISLVAVYAVVILGLNLITGYAGQISLGQSAFFGAGAYATSVAATHGWSAPAAFAVACALPAAVGALAAVPAVRLRGHALAMFTLALPVVAVQLAKRWLDLTGGSGGRTVAIGAAPRWSGLADDQWATYVVILVAAVLFLLARNLVLGRTGRALAMVRTNEVVAAAMGISVRGYKTLAFVLAAAYAGAGGFLYAYCVRFVSPDSLELVLGVTLLCCLVVGGLRSVTGAIVGAAFYVYVPHLAGTISPERSSIIYGGCLLLVVFFAPAGLVGTARQLAARLWSPS